jgi:hypothetical protein
MGGIVRVVKVLCDGSRGQTFRWQAGGVDATWRVPIGVAAGLPIAGAVGAYADDDGFLVFFWYGPMIVAVLTAGAAAVIRTWRLPWRDWWWVVAAPPVMWVVLLVGAVTSGPSGSLSEQRAGWTLVVLVMYGAASVGFARIGPRVVRVVVAVITVAAAPVMVAFDDLSQDRWRRAGYAGAPQVLPVVPGYTVIAARADRSTLEVDLGGPTTLWAWVMRCRDCTVQQEASGGAVTLVDGRYELVIRALASDAPWSPPDGIHLRPAGVDELAALPLAASRDSY